MVFRYSVLKLEDATIAPPPNMIPGHKNQGYRKLGNLSEDVGNQQRLSNKSFKGSTTYPLPHVLKKLYSPLGSAIISYAHVTLV